MQPKNKIQKNTKKYNANFTLKIIVLASLPQHNCSQKYVKKKPKIQKHKYPKRLKHKSTKSYKYRIYNAKVTLHQIIVVARLPQHKCRQKLAIVLVRLGKYFASLPLKIPRYAYPRNASLLIFVLLTGYVPASQCRKN